MQYGSVVDPRIGCYSLRLFRIVMQIISSATPHAVARQNMERGGGGRERTVWRDMMYNEGFEEHGWYNCMTEVLIYSTFYKGRNSKCTGVSLTGLCTAS